MIGHRRFMQMIMVFFGVLVGAAASCQTIYLDEQDITTSLQSSFDKIYLAKYGLNYPHSKKTLSRCVKYNDTQCLNTHQKVLDGKSTILSLPSDAALNTTLDIIKKSCVSKDQNVANFTCYGGIMSLYFYSTAAQDKKIIERVKQYPREVRNILFNNDFFWYHNRQDNQMWINYLSIAEVDWKYETRRQTVVDLFLTTIENADNEAWVLR